MANQWFKFWGGEYLNDPKMDALSAVDRSCWLTLLCLASESDIPGVIKYITEDYIFRRSGIKTSKERVTAGGLLKRLEILHMIRSDNGTVTILNWNKRQERASTVGERVKKHRLSNESVTHVTKCNESVTLEENRIEKNRSKGGFHSESGDRKLERVGNADIRKLLQKHE